MTDRDLYQEQRELEDQEVAETLDDDKLPGDYPPDQPLASEDYGVTARQEAVEEPIDERVARRERPDRPTEPEASDPELGQLVEPDQGGSQDDEPQAVAEAVADAPGRDIASGDTAFGDTTTRDAATERTPELAAEEAAVHEAEDPPMGDEVPPHGEGDGYIDLRDSTKQELYERAKELDIDGRSKMSKDDLVDAIARHRS